MKNYKYVVNNDKTSIDNFKDAKKRFNKQFESKQNSPRLISHKHSNKTNNFKNAEAKLSDDEFNKLSNRKIRRLEKRRNRFDSINLTKKLNSKRLSVRSISAAKFAQDETANFLGKGADDNAGVEAAQKGVNTTSKATSKLRHYVENHPSKITKRRIEKKVEKSRLKHEKKYDRKIHFQRSKLEYKNLVKETKLNDNNYVELNPVKKFFKRREMKKMIYAKNHTRIRDRIKNFIVDVGKGTLELVKKLVKKLLTGIVLVAIFILIFFNSCMGVGGGLNNTQVGVISTSYQAKQETLIDLEEYFGALETDLLNDINALENSSRPYYDEVHVNGREKIYHEVHTLLSYVTAAFMDVPDIGLAQFSLNSIFREMYKVKTEEKIIIKHKYEDVEKYSVDENGNSVKKIVKELVPYEYKILIINVHKKSMDSIVRNYLNSYKDYDVRIPHYESMLETHGNYDDLFADSSTGKTLDPENIPGEGEYAWNEGDSNFPPPNPFTILPGNTGAKGQCTWYVYNRIYQVTGKKIYSMGHGGDWAYRAQQQGYSVSKVARAGMAISIPRRVAGSDPNYGHVAFVEKVNSDGSIVVSEMNVKGKGVISTRTISASDAAKSYFIDFGG